MVSTSPNTTKILTTTQKTNITSAREQKQGEYNDIFFDRKVENVSIFHHNKAFKQIIREDILSFLDSFRKTESTDHLHK
jgi:hypothetical protein